MFDKTQAVFHTLLANECGVPEPIEAGDGHLFFRWFGFDYVMNCRSPQWLCLSITLTDASLHGINPRHRINMGTATPSDILVQLSRLNLQFSQLKFSLVGTQAIKIDWATYLFGSVTPPEPGADDQLPVIPPDQIIGPLDLALGSMSGGVRAVFEMFGQEPALLPHQFPGADQRRYCDSLPVFRDALTRQGFKWVETRQNDLPVLQFLDALGIGFRLFLAGNATGVFLLLFEFMEVDRFDPNAALVNVLDDVVEDGILDLCLQFGGRTHGVKFCASREQGYFALATGGFVTEACKDAVARLLPTLTNRLLGASSDLFIDGGMKVRSYTDETVRRRSVAEGVPGLTWRDRPDLHPWEALSGRRLSERVTGQAGRLFSGHVLSTEKGEVQVDHLLVCEAGVFVIECKAYKATIEGNRNGPWFQVAGAKKRRIHASWGDNPADQVLRGVHAARSHLTRAGTPAFIHGIVLFPNGARLSLGDVPVNAVRGTAPAAFTLDAFIDFLNQPRLDPSKALTPHQVGVMAHGFEAGPPSQSTQPSAPSTSTDAGEA